MNKALEKDIRDYLDLFTGQSTNLIHQKQKDNLERLLWSIKRTKHLVYLGLSVGVSFLLFFCFLSFSDKETALLLIGITGLLITALMTAISIFLDYSFTTYQFKKIKKQIDLEPTIIRRAS